MNRNEEASFTQSLGGPSEEEAFSFSGGAIMNGAKARELRKLTHCPAAPRDLFSGLTGGYVIAPERRMYQHAKRRAKGVDAAKALEEARSHMGNTETHGKSIKRRHMTAQHNNRSIQRDRQEAQRKAAQEKVVLSKVQPVEKRPWTRKVKSFIGSMFTRKTAQRGG